MNEKPKPKLFGLSPATYGIASVIAACLAWASVWLIFAGGSGLRTESQTFRDGDIVSSAVVRAGLWPAERRRRNLSQNWGGIVAGAIGLGMIGYEAWFLSFFLLDASR